MQSLELEWHNAHTFLYRVRDGFSERILNDSYGELVDGGVSPSNP